MLTFRKSFFTLLIALCVSAAAVPAQAQVGIAAGANFNSLSDVNSAKNDRSFDNATGFHAGIFYDLSLGALGIRPGAFYMDLGQLTADYNTDESTADEVKNNFDASLVAFPVDLRLNVISLPLISPYVLAGPVFRLALNNSDDDNSFTTNDFTVAGNVGVGAEISLPGVNWRLYPELRYSLGLSSYLSDLPGNFQAEDGGTLNVFMLRLGIGL